MHTSKNYSRLYLLETFLAWAGGSGYNLRISPAVLIILCFFNAFTYVYIS